MFRQYICVSSPPLRLFRYEEIWFKNWYHQTFEPFRCGLHKESLLVAFLDDSCLTWVGDSTVFFSLRYFICIFHAQLIISDQYIGQMLIKLSFFCSKLRFQVTSWWWSSVRFLLFMPSTNIWLINTPWANRSFFFLICQMSQVCVLLFQ